MKDLKHYLLLPILIAILAYNGTLHAEARDTEISVGSTNLGLSSENSVEFEINVEESGAYYMEFWMMPAKHPDNTYSKYIVSVNDTYAGTITPVVGNWQALRIDGNKTSKLGKGVNKVVIKAPSPEYPLVESMRISRTDKGSLFNSQEYDEFLSEAKEGGVSSKSIAFPDLNTPMSTTTEAVFDDVPLEYTFHAIKEFYENQDIFIATSSTVEHNIDMVFLGTPGFPNFVGSNTSTPDVSINGFGDLIERPNYAKLRLSYTQATSDEMQGLNWRGPSEYSLNSTSHLATIHITIPKDGYYFLRVRTKDAGKIGVADVNINGDYFYEDVPISYSMVSYSIPANGEKYVCMARSSRPGYDDTLLFVEGNRSEKIVGFNDDCSSSNGSLFKLGYYDSYFADTYKVKTSGISVSNYSSVSPKSTCSIIVRKFDSSNKIARSNASYVGDDIADGYIDGMPYVDLGLPSGTLWAMHNLGAGNSSEYGEYYAWGETAPKNEYDWDNYMYFDRQIMDPKIGLWCVTEDIGEDIQYTRHDAASAEWGDNWGMPTEDQLRELRRLCWHEWVEENGVCGVRVHGPNKHSIFLPAGGIVEKKGDSAPPYANLDGLYWGSTQSVLTDIDESCNQAAYVLAFDRGGFGVVNRQDKCSGINIRPVANSGALSSVSSVADEEILISSSDEEILVKGCGDGNRIEIYDLSGKLLISGKADGNTFRHVFSGKGVYIVAVSDGKAVKKVKKLIL